MTHLDSTGAYEARTDDVTPPIPSEHLKVTNTWVLFGRKRSGDIFLEDIRRLKKSVEESSSLPEVIKSFVERGDTTVRVHAEQPFRGLASSESVEGAKDLFFPMPYNDEQVSIVQKLYTNDGVVVQGPPGTGKSHTIANVICHYLAEGKRVLVVTLLGNAQAAHIHELVSEEISPVDIVGRKIAIGPPPVFQGRERDIMLVSMVSAPGDRTVANRADMHQRFNVALSRARDRMYLFRSLSETEVSADALTGKVIGHFKQPFQQDVRRVQALRERCESGFEQEMFDELVKRGFRVEPQVTCGRYRIDFVVEGNEGRRLAIECDGDRFHGPRQWQDDMTRQRVLERAGWTFWRCFASSFVRRRQAVLDDLMGTLADLGIEPLGAESVDNTVWVSYKEVDPFGVETQEQEEEGV